MACLNRYFGRTASERDFSNFKHGRLQQLRGAHVALQPSTLKVTAQDFTGHTIGITPLVVKYPLILVCSQPATAGRKESSSHQRRTWTAVFSFFACRTSRTLSGCSHAWRLQTRLQPTKPTTSPNTTTCRQASFWYVLSRCLIHSTTISRPSNDGHMETS